MAPKNVITNNCTLSMDVVWAPAPSPSPIKFPNLFPTHIVVNEPLAFVFWNDETKTPMTCLGGDDFNVREMIIQAYFKRAMGHFIHSPNGSTKRRNRYLNAAEKLVTFHTPNEKKKKNVVKKK